MTSVGRGRGYTGRHHLREEPRPGDEPKIELKPEIDKLSDLSVAQDGRLDFKPEPDFQVHDGLEEKFVNCSEDIEIVKQLLYVDEQHKPLINLLEQFCPGEDGIQFNRKLRQFETSITNLYTEEIRLNEAFSSLRGAALTSASTTRKLAAVGASFTRQQRRQLHRNALLNAMQATYLKLDVLARSNPKLLINAANLMGDYFAEARLHNGNKVQMLASPLVHYMRALLASDDIRAHRSLATQLMQNGAELMNQQQGQALDDLAISIRIRLLTPPPVSTIWLLLSADLCLNKFLPLPNTLQQFYASHLDLNHEPEPNPGYSEVNYGSWKKPEDELNVSIPESEVNLSAEKVAQLNLSNDDSLDLSKPKLRPILGAGAGLLRQEHTQTISVNQDTYDTWQSKPNKRYDLNSWRQNDEEKDDPEPVFNPAVLPPSIPGQSYPQITVPDYPPPNYQPYDPSYMQQGDGKFVQNLDYKPTTEIRFQAQDPPAPAVYPDVTFAPTQQQFSQSQERLAYPDKQLSQQSQEKKKPVTVENWRKEKSEPPKDEPKKTWARQKSKDSVEAEFQNDKKELGGGDVKNFQRSNSKTKESTRENRPRSKKTSESGEKPPARRHVTDVPRSQKYWDHDDRCDKDYSS